MAARISCSRPARGPFPIRSPTPPKAGRWRRIASPAPLLAGFTKPNRWAAWPAGGTSTAREGAAGGGAAALKPWITHLVGRGQSGAVESVMARAGGGAFHQAALIYDRGPATATSSCWRHPSSGGAHLRQSGRYGDKQSHHAHFSPDSAHPQQRDTYCGEKQLRNAHFIARRSSAVAGPATARSSCRRRYIGWH